MDNLQYLFSPEMFFSIIRLAIPLALAAIGTTFCERSGIINLGVEGMMLMGAWGGVYGSHVTGNPWVGTLVAVTAGALMGLLHAVLCIRLRTNQSVSGVGINLFVSGITVVLTKVIWTSDGRSGTVTQVPMMSVPILKDLPIVGRLFTNQSPYIYLTFLIVGLSWFVMYRTKVGLRLRAIGDHPQAAETVGINVSLYRYVAVTVCGALCGLAGAYLSIVQNNSFVSNMVAGRGFMAIAANIFGGWNPLGSFLASLVFAVAQAIRINLSLDIPDQFIQMLPYILTLIALVCVGRKTKGPTACGEIGD
ncbi:MAG: ABC transporter permease [Eubacteriales bacterium]